MGEIKILTGEDETVQKTLNQWRHQFNLNIIHVQSFGNNTTYVMVERIKK